MQKKILITGATGLVATELIITLLQNSDCYLTLISRNVDILKERYKMWEKRIYCATLNDIIIITPIPEYDAVIHTAFSRSSNGRDIAESLEYLEKLCKWIEGGIVNKFVNISSQSVYGNDYPIGITETQSCAPNYMYALGKYASELIVEAILSSTEVNIYNIRLASVCENARFIKIFVENVLERRPSKIVAPNQIVSFIDVRDVAVALTHILNDNEAKGGVYNLGTGKWYSIFDVAQKVLEIGFNKYHIPNEKLIIEDNGTTAAVGMDSSLFQKTFKWYPKYSLEIMIESIFEMLINVRGGISDSL